MFKHFNKPIIFILGIAVGIVFMGLMALNLPIMNNLYNSAKNNKADNVKSPEGQKVSLKGIVKEIKGDYLMINKEDQSVVKIMFNDSTIFYSITKKTDEEKYGEQANALKAISDSFNGPGLDDRKSSELLKERSVLLNEVKKRNEKNIKIIDEKLSKADPNNKDLINQLTLEKNQINSETKMLKSSPDAIKEGSSVNIFSINQGENLLAQTIQIIN
ncbi:MAG: hypothetical protein PHR00_01740 [Patescibacteria group bacterium]|nr:hypothetical protein [Patescibacteria group bacterium]